MPERRPARPRRPTLEPLDGRALPSGVAGDFTIAGAWADRHVTYGFAPDGPASNLDATMTAEVGPDWESLVASAFHAWQASANLTLTRVADGGQPEDIAGSAQGDPRFGDIRIAGHDLGSPTVLAETYSPSAIGTSGGDIAFNTGMHWDARTLYSVSLHEIGHAIGLGHAADPGDVMYPVLEYQAGLGDGDVSGARSMYGPPPTEGANGPVPHLPGAHVRDVHHHRDGGQPGGLVRPVWRKHGRLLPGSHRRPALRDSEHHAEGRG